MKLKYSESVGLDIHLACRTVMVNFVSPWQSHRMPSYLFKYFWTFQMKLAFELVIWGKQVVLSTESGHHLTHWEQKGRGKVNSHCLVGLWSSPTIHAPACQAFRPGLGTIRLAVQLSAFWTPPPASLDIQMADGRVQDFSAFLIVWANYIYMHMYVSWPTKEERGI